MWRRTWAFLRAGRSWLDFEVWEWHQCFVTVTDALPEAEGAATLWALTVTVLGEGTELGAR